MAHPHTDDGSAEAGEDYTLSAGRCRGRREGLCLLLSFASQGDIRVRYERIAGVVTLTEIGRSEASAVT